MGYALTIEQIYFFAKSCFRIASQEKLPLYVGFFEFVHNVRKRGKALLPALIELLVT